MSDSVLVVVGGEVASWLADGPVVPEAGGGPMTLLVEVAGPLADDERRRIERFVALLGRQAE